MMSLAPDPAKLKTPLVLANYHTQFPGKNPTTQMKTQFPIVTKAKKTLMNYTLLLTTKIWI
jgi:hypothetical protein